MITIKLTPNQERELNEYVETHVDNCIEWANQIENDEEPTEFEPFESFCSCRTCIQRETLYATFKYLENTNLLKLEKAL